MQEEKKHSILLGGIGGDSHSVGLTILRQTLSMSGFSVLYAGVQSSLEDLFEISHLFNVVMLSNMDGHAAHYLRAFPEIKKAHLSYQNIWYLGGNIHIGDDIGNEEVKKYFLQMGFDRVFVRFTEIQQILETLEHDLIGVEPKSGCYTEWRKKHALDEFVVTVSDGMLERDEWERPRREVLDFWRTGREAKDIVGNAEFLKRQPSFAAIQSRVNNGHLSPLLQPRAGVPFVQKQLELFDAFKRYGIKVLSYQVDSLTRNGYYKDVESAFKLFQSHEAIDLNGFPVVNHGIPALRKISSLVKVPLQTRHSARDPRLLAEVSYAGGVTSFEGGCICYNIPYYKDYPLNESIRRWQYVDYLTGLYYQQFGIILDREFFGVLTGTLIPPSIAILTNVLEMILAVQQGVKCVSLGYAEQGNRVQDIAAIRVLRKVAYEVLIRLGYKDIQVNTIFNQYMAAFPQDLQKARELVYNSAITATLSGATRIIVKTPVEAYHIPSLADNLCGIQLASQGVKDALSEKLDEVVLEQEEYIIYSEFQDMFESVIFCGHGSFTEGIIRAFQRGLIDIPFSPSIYNKGEVMTARDIHGAVRFASVGKIQLRKEIIEFHRDKMQERRKQEGIPSEKQSYLLVEKDVLRVARNEYARWPLDHNA